MKIHHPDRGGDNGRTKDLIEARRILLDPTLRATYDRQLQVMDQRRAPAPTPPPRPASPMPLPRKFDTPDPDAGAEAHEQMKRQIGRALEILGPFVLIIILVGLALLALSGVLVK
jgi:curved DNA-binding protein CbpA